MKALLTQDDFEQYLGIKEFDGFLPDLTVILFSASWCGPCRKIDTVMLETQFVANWLKCDIDQNDYTAGYCGIRSIPSFLVIYKKKIIDIKQSSNTLEILQWLQSLKLY
jgi:thiol-disulfide isomerase/thioredoxin